MSIINFTNRRTVLLTGAGGVVGQALLEQLGDHNIICLTHRKPVTGRGVLGIRGDLTAPRFGLDREEYDDLAGRIDAIVHCAAITGFSVDKGATEDLNVRGTAEILALAERAGVPLHHVSTAFVARKDLARDTGSTARPEVYLDSKRAAEHLVRESGVAANIIRPSVVIGDSVTGRIAQFQGLHGIAGAMLKNALPLVPLRPDARVDFIPQDLLARAIAGLVRAGTQAGTVGGDYWITAGEAALTAGRIVELALETGRSLGLELDLPRLVSQDMVDRLIRPVFIDPLPDKQRRRFDDMLAMTVLFCTPEPFACCCDRVPGLAALTPAELEGAFVASLRYYAEAKGLARRVAA
ncbi:SDR family oxidoreductase [Nonomuraea basaltis]|uniref:SDR family oxidoreductase n=1 Tax=Nonomuraea basaltis TaxID=2495887 RepID=UPI00110C5AC0|nr:SDR family oxidoreductase [Nonomuraea basaltis]TMR95763.1 NAD-dependent epimerase/dehydratase family protein [Nonomuraea basaltis]